MDSVWRTREEEEEEEEGWSFGEVWWPAIPDNEEKENERGRVVQERGAAVGETDSAVVAADNKRERHTSHK